MGRYGLCLERRTEDMSTVIRPELSKKNEYWLEKHRYYELKHFCLQYPIWNQEYTSLNGFSSAPGELLTKPTGYGDPTFDVAEKRMYYSVRMDMIKDAIYEADPDLGIYIFKGITEGLSYETLKARLEIPCSKDTYYNRYRKFFYLLDKSRK